MMMGCVDCRDGASNVHFLGIDVSMEALYMARTNVMKQCPQLSSKSIEMVCADYLEGLKQARARYVYSGHTSLIVAVSVTIQGLRYAGSLCM